MFRFLPVRSPLSPPFLNGFHALVSIFRRSRSGSSKKQIFQNAARLPFSLANLLDANAPSHLNSQSHSAANLHRRPATLSGAHALACLKHKPFKTLRKYHAVLLVFPARTPKPFSASNHSARVGGTQSVKAFLCFPLRFPDSVHSVVPFGKPTVLHIPVSAPVSHAYARS